MHETGYEKKPGHYPSFGDFKTWLESKHNSLYLNFLLQASTLYLKPRAGLKRR